jgi:hypothetical protein
MPTAILPLAPPRAERRRSLFGWKRRVGRPKPALHPAMLPEALQYDLGFRDSRPWRRHT